MRKLRFKKIDDGEYQLRYIVPRRRIVERKPGVYVIEYLLGPRPFHSWKPYYEQVTPTATFLPFNTRVRLFKTVEEAQSAVEVEAAQDAIEQAEEARLRGFPRIIACYN